MKLPWRRRAEQDGARGAADEAIEVSARRRDRAVERSHEFRRLAARMRKIREVNHLAEAFEQTFGEGRN